MKISNSIILIISLLLIGCGSDKEEKAKVISEAESKAEAVTITVFSLIAAAMFDAIPRPFSSSSVVITSISR